MALSTSEMIKNIQISSNISDFIEVHDDEFIKETAKEYLNSVLAEKKLHLSDVAERSGLDTYCYRIFSGARRPSRNSLLRIAIGLGLTVDETQHALRLYQLSQLDPRCYRDAALIFAISKGLDLSNTLDLLCELNEAEL